MTYRSMARTRDIMAGFTGGMLVWLLVMVTQGTLCEGWTENSLLVKRGRTAYLHPDELGVTPAEGELCKVQVVSNDPMTQRVGQMQPPVFDCDFQPYSVRYIHNGNPLLPQDLIKLHVHIFTQTSTIVHQVRLKIRITNAKYETFVSDPRLRTLEVSEFFGTSKPIDPSVVRFRYNYYDGATCTVSYSKLDTGYPMYGQMIMGDNGEVVDMLSHDCRDFLYLGLRYKHLSPPTPDRDYLTLTVELSDPSKGEEPTVEHMWLPIRIRGAFPNTAPKASFMSSYIMEVDQYILATVDPEVMSAHDSETPDESLVFNITKPPKAGEGFFVHLEDHTMPVNSFLQADLMNHQIAYHPPNVTYKERKIIEVEFEAYDSQFTVSSPILLHIALRPSSTNAPRVTVNTGLMLVEGQSRPITTENLLILDSDNAEDVRVYVKGGLRHGRLEVEGKPSVMFSLEDLQSGRIVYKHDDSDSLEDRMVLRISDHTDTIRTKFPIHVLPRDDSPPYLVNNVGLVVTEGEYVQITENQLSAHDKDSDDAHILYLLKSPPEAGEIVRKYRPMTAGHRISKFSQLDLIRGLIYYHHLGGEKNTDSFEFRLVDNNDPPNKSGKYGVTIIVNPVDDMPPQIVQGSSRSLLVKETEIIAITDKMLQYTDAESPDEDLLYTITNQPFFLTTTITIDAGRIVSTDNATLMMKDPQTPAVHTFRQSEINHLKIAYMPPYEDIGPIRRHARFIYTVSDSQGNKVMDQPFDITLMPVNNQLPHMTVRRLIVLEGGSVRVSTNDISAYDPDTDQDNLKFILEEKPKFGHLLKDQISMVAGEWFTLNDLIQPSISYIHDGSEITSDSFTLSVSDSHNKVTKNVHIDVRLVNDHNPMPLKNLRSNIHVQEGGITIISSSNIAATDNDTDDKILNFITMRSPQYGEIRLRGRPVTQFSQAHVWHRDVMYVHTSGEVGMDTVQDSATFAVTDQAYGGMADTPLLDLNISIIPVDNQPPYVILGAPLLVNEGQSSQISFEVLSAQDVDTPIRDLKFFITKPSDWGYLENTKPDRGSERSNSGKSITSFTVMDVKDGTVNYVQANHTKVEPLSDAFEVYVTDGKLNSAPSLVQINIIPQNDEFPELSVGNFHVEEGGEIILNPESIVAKDSDIPRENLLLSVADDPMHGKLALMMRALDEPGLVEVDMYEVFMEDLGENIQLIYRHDGSESLQDKFTLQVSDGNHIAKSTGSVSIQALNDEHPQMAKNTGLVVNYGSYGTISSMELRSMDIDNEDDKIYFVMVSSPRKGILQLRDAGMAAESKDNSGRSEWVDVVDGMNYTQHDVNANRVRYLHTGGMSESGTDSFVFQVTDGYHKMPPETFEIEILNSKAADIAILSKGMNNVKEGDSKVIMTDILSAADENTKPQGLVFHITRPPMQGHLGLITEKNTPISHFTQMDLAAQKIVYTHTSKADVTEDSFHFYVISPLNVTKSGVFKITIDPMDKELPTLAANMPLTVVQGNEAKLTPFNLLLTDPDTAFVNLTYVITDPPQHGILLKNDAPINGFFTQQEIDQGLVSYQSDRSDDSGVDFFLFMVSDNHHDGYLINGTLETRPAFFNILIQPLSKEPPKMITSQSPRLLESLGNGKYGFILTEQHLKAVHPMSTDMKIIYTMLVKPTNGYMENLESGKVIKKRFKQRDIDDKKIAYVLDSASYASNDSFTFRVQDANRNTLDNQRFELEWAVIEVSQPQYIVCEDAGMLTVTMTRTGALAESSYVDIKAKPLAAKDGQDFKSSDINQIQFDPGQTTASWDIEIVRDDLEESNEKFRVLLKNPVNAILGERDKTNVQIVDLRNGRCAEYIGMISKDTPDPVPVVPPRRTAPSDSASIHQYHAVHSVSLENLDQGDTQGFGDQSFLSEDLSSSEDEEDDDYEEEGDETRGFLDEEIFDLGELEVRKKEIVREETSRRGERRRGGGGGGRKGGRKGRRKKGRGKKNRRKEEEDQEPESTTETAAGSSNVEFLRRDAPQPCTKDTRGLLFFDLKSARMYRCNGGQWEKWDPNNIHHNRMFNTAPESLDRLISTPAEKERDHEEEQKRKPEPDRDVSKEVERERIRQREWEREKTWAWESQERAEEEVEEEDQCPPGWSRYRDDCYKAFKNRFTWDEGERRCRDFGGHLAHVESAKHLTWMRRLTEADSFWIGLNDKRLHHVWEYASGGPVRFYHWRKGFPRSQVSLAKHCVLVAKKMEWVNRPCDKNSANFVCTKPSHSARPINNRRRRRRRRRYWEESA